MPALNLVRGFDLAADATFQKRVAVAFFFVARRVFTEKVDTADHPLRVNFARSILQQDYKQFQQYAAMVVTDPTIVESGPASQDLIPDTVLIDAVARMWTALSGGGS